MKGREKVLDRVYPWSDILDRALVRARYRFVRKLIEKIRCRLKIVDVGVGFGIGLKELTGRNHWIVALDIDPYCLKYVKLVYPNVDCVRASAEHLPFRRESINVILLMDLIEHVKQPEQVLSECVTILSPHGLLVLSTPNKNAVKHNPHHVREYTVKELVRLLSKYEFKKIYTFGQIPVDRFVTVLDKFGFTEVINRTLKLVYRYGSTLITQLIVNEEQLVDMLGCEPYAVSIRRDYAHLVVVAHW